MIYTKARAAKQCAGSSGSRRAALIASFFPCLQRIVRRGDKCRQGVAVRHEGADAPERVRRVGVLHVAFDGKRSEHSGEGGFFRAIIARALEPDAGKRRFRGFPVPPVAPGPRASGASASAGTVSGRTSRQTRCLLAIILSRCFFAFPIAETAAPKGAASVFPWPPSPLTPQAAGPCSWACRRLLCSTPQPERNAARPPPARGAGARQHGANGYWPPALPARRVMGMRMAVRAVPSAA